VPTELSLEAPEPASVTSPEPLELLEELPEPLELLEPPLDA
jgi:hypothetical protein